MTRALLLVAVVGCAQPTAIESSSSQPLPSSTRIELGPTEPHRLVPPEAYLRAYLMWFGGLAPRQLEHDARPGGLFDTWADYLAALGLPDYKRDLPRQEQTNTMMLATIGRLGEALCARAAEHDLHKKTPLEGRIVFRFESTTADDPSSFASKFDMLHRKFLGYPVRLAPADRVQRFYSLFRAVEAKHAEELTLPVRTGNSHRGRPVCGNASTTKPAKSLVLLVKNKDAPVLNPVK